MHSVATRLEHIAALKVERMNALLIRLAVTVALMVTAASVCDSSSLSRAKPHGPAWGYMDRQGKPAVSPSFTHAGIFRENLAAVCITDDLGNDKWGYVDVRGEMIIPPSFDFASDFRSGLAAVCVGHTPCEPTPSDGVAEPSRPSETCATVSSWGFINRSGELVLKAQWQYASAFSEGLAVVGFGGNDVTGTEKSGYIDRTGKLVIPAKFLDCEPFSNGLAWVLVATPSGYLYGAIDKAGKFVIQPKYTETQSFSGGLAVVRCDGKYGYIDKTGAPITKPVYDAALGFSEGLAAVYQNNKGWGYINSKGNLAIPFSFGSAKEFSDGLAAVYDGNKWGYIDKKGNLIIGYKYDEVLSFCEGLALVEMHGRECYIDRNAKVRFWLGDGESSDAVYYDSAYTSSDDRGACFSEGLVRYKMCGF